MSWQHTTSRGCSLHRGAGMEQPMVAHVPSTRLWLAFLAWLSPSWQPIQACSDTKTVSPAAEILSIQIQWWGEHLLLYNVNSQSGKVASFYWQDHEESVTLTGFRSSPRLLGPQSLTKTRTTRTPAFWGYPPPPHEYPFYWFTLDPKSKEDKVKVTNLKNLPKLQIFEFWHKLYTQHTFWSCLIRCANMKWIQQIWLKIQSGHDSVHRRTDGQTDRRTRWNQYTPLSTSLKRWV